MNGRKTIVGVCMLCALLISAFAAQSASAITGTTVFTCKEGAGDGGATFAGSHCKTGESSGKYGHYKVAENTSTELRGHAVGSMIIKSTIGGSPVTFTSTSVEGSGSVQNLVDESGEHYVQAETQGIYSGVTINVPKCFVYTDDGTGTPGTQGVIDTEVLTTTSKGQGDAVKFTPKEGEAISKLWILDKNKKGAGGECSCPGTFTLTGSVLGKPDGATFIFKHAEMTEQNTFKLGSGGGGSKAGFEGSIALEAKDPVIEKDTFKPLSVTTVTT
ncbi:MAG TPA: hypothetical protein VMS60_10570 [Solirubrobacterales bacterium]|nr:hypothetical protein [Solirubrobacterales bacterium]